MSNTSNYPEFTLEELEALKKEVFYSLCAYHNVPSKQVGEALICNLYNKYALRFGLNPTGQ